MVAAKREQNVWIDDLAHAHHVVHGGEGAAFDAKNAGPNPPKAQPASARTCCFSRHMGDNASTQRRAFCRRELRRDLVWLMGSLRQVKGLELSSRAVPATGLRRAVAFSSAGSEVFGHSWGVGTFRHGSLASRRS